MFTGLISAVGKVNSYSLQGGDAKVSIRPMQNFSSFAIGESIAVNGACLTVESFNNYSFTAFASQETLKVTNLKELKKGDQVNLERALSVGDRLGGHMVSGHVDCVGKLCTITSIGSSLNIRITVGNDFLSQIIPKGSVCTDGISLTVNGCGSNYFEVNVIPETAQATTIATWNIGKSINIETDVIGKYVQHFMQYFIVDKQNLPKQNSVIDMDFLQKHGF